MHKFPLLVVLFVIIVARAGALICSHQCNPHLVSRLQALLMTMPRQLTPKSDNFPLKKRGWVGSAVLGKSPKKSFSDPSLT